MLLTLLYRGFRSYGGRHYVHNDSKWLTFLTILVMVAGLFYAYYLWDKKQRTRR